MFGGSRLKLKHVTWKDMSVGFSELANRLLRDEQSQIKQFVRMSCYRNSDHAHEPVRWPLFRGGHFFVSVVVSLPAGGDRDK